MQMCDGVVVVVDREAIIFTRIWCGFEQAMVVQGEQLLLDFSRGPSGPLDGPSEYAGVFEAGAIRFPDGAEWRKRPCSSPSLNDRQRAACVAALAAAMK